LLGLVVAWVGACGVACGVACNGGGGPDAARPKEIEQTFPNPGDTIIAQGEVGADVPQAWSITLTIDGIPIPADQISVKVPELGIYKFQPRPGRIIERFNRGDHRAAVHIEPPTPGPAVDYAWTFRVST
jgi:hypothetical protein